jgi:glycine/D-amino acid oxidase-like deaminating enzyme
LGVPCWLAANRPRRTFPALALDTSTEVVIIGGGMTGCAAARVRRGGDRNGRAQSVIDRLATTTPDGLRYIGPHRRYPRHLFALGYGGNGMTVGFLAAGILVRQHRGVAQPDDRLFAFARRER